MPTQYAIRVGKKVPTLHRLEDVLNRNFLTTKGNVSMKYLLLLLALIVVPAWAADAVSAITSGAPSASAVPAQVEQPAKNKPA